MKPMLLSKCSVCRSKKPRFIKKQEAKWLLGKTIGKIPIIGPLIILIKVVLISIYLWNNVILLFEK